VTKEEQLSNYIIKIRDLVIDENCSLDENFVMFEALAIVAKDLLHVTMEDYQALQVVEQSLKDMSDNKTIH
jgi:hypothetical protein|tara:strand:+ start:3538 stop:3750 length:213 start_codon:yes stop_codon:yes gene_type:complete